MTRGASSRMEEVDQNEVDAEKGVAEEERSTHFLAIRVTDPELVANLCRFQDIIAAPEPILRDGHFHLTIGVLRLEGLEGLVAARSIMDQLRPVVEEMFRDQDSAALEIDRLGNFGQRVVFANVSQHLLFSLIFFTSNPVQVLPRNEFWFSALVDACKGAVNAAGPLVIALRFIDQNTTKQWYLSSYGTCFCTV